MVPWMWNCSRPSCSIARLVRSQDGRPAGLGVPMRESGMGAQAYHAVWPAERVACGRGGPQVVIDSVAEFAREGEEHFGCVCCCGGGWRVGGVLGEKGLVGEEGIGVGGRRVCKVYFDAEVLRVKANSPLHKLLKLRKCYMALELKIFFSVRSCAPYWHSIAPFVNSYYSWVLVHC
jgi:hypothetical protein